MTVRMDNLKRKKVTEDYVGEKEELEGKKKRLEERRDTWERMYQEALQKKGGEKGMNKLHKKKYTQKIIFHSISFVYLFACGDIE